MASPEIHFLKAEAYAMGYGVAQDMAKAEEESRRPLSANPSPCITITIR